MIAQLEDGAVVQTTYQRFLEALAEASFVGDIASDYANRTVLATDNSIYQRLPQAVLYPHGARDHRHPARTDRGQISQAQPLSMAKHSALVNVRYASFMDALRATTGH